MATGYVVPERPDWTRARLAPAGDRFAAVRWYEGAANVWVGSGRSPMRLVSDPRPWRLRDYAWSAAGRGLILVLEQASGRRVVAWLDLRTATLTRLTPGLGADARYAGQCDGSRPGVLIGVRHPYTNGFRLQSVTLAGAVVAEWQAPTGHAERWLATSSQAVAVCPSADPCHDDAADRRRGDCTWWHTRLDERSWSPICAIPAADARTSRPLAFSSDGQTLYALSSAGRDTVALVRMTPPSWRPEVVTASSGFDVTSVLMAPDGTGPDLVTTTDPVQPQHTLTAAAAADLDRLRQVADGAPASIVGRNDSHCLAEVSYPVGGPAFITFGRAGDDVSRPLFRFTEFARRRMPCRSAFTFEARDGLVVTGFITRPAAPPPWPVVLAIHDGPGARDLPQLDPWAQHLAAAGFCCVQVNYRGSRGFGKSFRDAGNRQWSLAMQQDLVDALRSAQIADAADPRRIGAVGYGYGGYAALMLATQKEVPLAAVASAGAPTDLVRYVRGLMSFGGPAGLEQAARIGHPEDDRDLLVSASPLSRAADIGVPVLLVHGRQDAQVPVVHATMLADALSLAGGRCELTIYEDEGHALARPQNVADLRARTISFLRANLGNPASPAARARS